MRFLRRSLAGLLLLALTFGLLAIAAKTMFDAIQVRMAQDDQARPQRERVLAVNVLTPEIADIAPVLTSFGEVRARRTLDLRASAGGQIIELADSFEEGGRVEAGQLLARIDPTDAQAALAVARTDLAEAEAGVREAENALTLANDDLVSAREQADLREAALARAIDLRDKGVGTAASVETAELAASSARQAVLSRRQSLANAEAALDRARTTLARQGISLAEAERNLADSEIYADFTGTLAEVTVVEGGLVTTNERIAQIVDTDALEVSFRVSTPQYARLLGPDGDLLGAEVRVALDVMGIDLVTKGRVTRESAAVGEGQTGRLLFAAIDDTKGFRPGDFVSVHVTEPVLTGVAVLPATALGADDTVLVLDADDRLQALPVELLRRQGDEVIIRAAGLADQRVVSERTPLLGVGIKVRAIVPVTPGAQPAPAPADQPEEMLELDDERRARLVAFVEGNQFMPKDAKDRILAQLQQEKVPAQVVNRLESRMGG